MLLVAVIGIWGFIGFRIVLALNPELPKPEPKVFSVNFNPKAPIKLDTFSIHKVKRDPFLGTLQKTTTPVVKQNITYKSTLQWPMITYNGLIKSQSTADQIFVVNINNKQYLLKKGQTMDSVVLINGNHKTITLRYRNHKKTFNLN